MSRVRESPIITYIEGSNFVEERSLLALWQLLTYNKDYLRYNNKVNPRGGVVNSYHSQSLLLIHRSAIDPSLARSLRNSYVSGIIGPGE